MTLLILGILIGLVLGAFTTMGWATVWALGDAVVARLLAPGFDAHADQAIANTVEQPPCPDCGERCDVCEERMCAEYGPEPAPTCDSHRLCTSCDDIANTCTGCAQVRVAALREASA